MIMKIMSDSRSITLPTNIARTFSEFSHDEQNTQPFGQKTSLCDAKTHCFHWHRIWCKFVNTSQKLNSAMFSKLFKSAGLSVDKIWHFSSNWLIKPSERSDWIFCGNVYTCLSFSNDQSRGIIRSHVNDVNKKLSLSDPKRYRCAQCCSGKHKATRSIVFWPIFANVVEDGDLLGNVDVEIHLPVFFSEHPLDTFNFQHRVSFSVKLTSFTQEHFWTNKTAAMGSVVS